MGVHRSKQTGSINPEHPGNQPDCWYCKRKPAELSDREDTSPPMCRDCREAEEKHHAAQDREHELEQQHGGKRRCPKCDQFTVDAKVTPTRQYGGGSDTYERCLNEGCDYAEVFV